LALFSKKCVLVVEDRDSQRWTIHSILTHMGYDVIAVGTLLEGLAALDRLPDAILLDLVLPDGPGELLLEAAVAAGFARRVIVSTSDENVVRLKSLDSFEPAAILHKPIALADLVVTCHALKQEARNDVSALLGGSEQDAITAELRCA
jgi:DNA-binding response OmpR family regulator